VKRRIVWEHGAFSDRGRVRSDNQDTSLALGAQYGAWDLLLLVADGMGGHAGGKQASTVAAESFVKHLSTESWAWGSDDAEVLASVEKAFAHAHDAVRALDSDGGSMSPGTTLTCALLRGDRCYVGHVGDSRAYIVHHGYIEQVTEDDTWIADQVRKGNVDADAALRSPFRSQLTQAVGIGERSVPSVEVWQLKPGSNVLLCTDGLYEYVSETEMVRALREGESLQGTAERLARMAVERGGEDNVTVVVAGVQGADRTAAGGTGTRVLPTRDETQPVRTREPRRHRRCDVVLLGLALVLVGLGGIVASWPRIAHREKTGTAAVTPQNAAEANYAQRLQATGEGVLASHAVPAGPPYGVSSAGTESLSVSSRSSVSAPPHAGPPEPTHTSVEVTLNGRELRLRATEPGIALHVMPGRAIGRASNNGPDTITYNIKTQGDYDLLRTRVARVTLWSDGKQPQVYVAPGAETWHLERDRLYEVRFSRYSRSADFILLFRFRATAAAESGRAGQTQRDRPEVPSADSPSRESGPPSR